MYKTYAGKYNTSSRKIIRKHSKNGVFAIPYTDRKGKLIFREFYRGGFKRKKAASTILNDKLPYSHMRTGGVNSLMKRLSAGSCEYCSAKSNLEMHHVRKLKDLKGKEEWEKVMIARKRKTLAVCAECHDKIHAGKLD